MCAAGVCACARVCVCVCAAADTLAAGVLVGARVAQVCRLIKQEARKRGLFGDQAIVAAPEDCFFLHGPAEEHETHQARRLDPYGPPIAFSRAAPHFWGSLGAKASPIHSVWEMASTAPN